VFKSYFIKQVLNVKFSIIKKFRDKKIKETSQIRKDIVEEKF